MNRILAVAKMQTRQWPLAIIPWGIITVVLGANVAILAIIRSQGVELPSEQFNGVVSSIFFFIATMYGVAMTQLFPFALSLGVTRREYFGGTLVAAAGHGVITAAVLTVMSAIESATNGFVVHLKAFSVVNYLTENYALTFLGLTALVIAFAAIGALIGTVYLHWKAPGVFGIALVAAVALAGSAVVITWRQAWPAVGRFFTDTPAMVPIVVLPLVLAVLAFAGGSALLRRAEV